MDPHLYYVHKVIDEAYLHAVARHDSVQGLLLVDNPLSGSVEVFNSLNERFHLL